MIDESSPYAVLLVGATGGLGARITHHVLSAATREVRVLARPSSASTPRTTGLLRDYEARGATIVVGDLTDPDSLARTTTGIDIVVSAVHGGPDVVTDGQVALARAAHANGAWRIVPSDFTPTVLQAPAGRRPSIEWRRLAGEQISRLGIEHVHIVSGAFLERVDELTFDHRARTHSIWGDGQPEIDVVTVDDVARVTARAALDPDLVSGTVAVIGDRLSPLNMAAVVERITGVPYAIVRRGSVADLQAMVNHARTIDDVAEQDRLGYLLELADGSALVRDQQDRYPELRIDSFETFTRRRLGQG